MPSVRISRQLFDPLPGRRDGRRPMRFAPQASGLRAGAPVVHQQDPLRRQTRKPAGPAAMTARPRHQPQGCEGHRPRDPAIRPVPRGQDDPMTTRGGLFLKYVVLFVILVSGALVTSGLVEIYFSYQENKAALVRVQREKAVAAAARIEQFVREVERQAGWIAQSPWAARSVPVDQRRFDSLRLLRQVPAITEVSHLDRTGHEQLRVSRLAMDVVGSNADYAREAKFLEAKARRTYFSPVYFRKESEPYMTIALAGSGEDAGVIAAEVNLKFIWDVVSQIKIGKNGYAYV